MNKRRKNTNDLKFKGKMLKFFYCASVHTQREIKTDQLYLILNFFNIDIITQTTTE